MRPADAMSVGETASSGVAALDDALGGIFWGDNVVWEVEEGGSAEPFYRAIGALAGDYDTAVFVTTERDPAEIAGTYPGLSLIDARRGATTHAPGALLGAVRRACGVARRDLVLVDTLDALARSWGPETVVRFFARTCPLLLELSAVAYWCFTPSAHPAAVRREIEDVTQCVLALGNDRLRIGKADGRPAGVQGTVFRLRVADDGVPQLDLAPTAARLGAALLALRVNRGLSQSQLARLAGVSASAISQAERGQRGLSLDTLLALTGELGITLDELLRGEVAPGYRLARRHEPAADADGKPLPLLDDAATGLRAYAARLAPRASGSPAVPHAGVELVAVAEGLVQVVLTTGRPVVRAGEAILVDQARVQGWRNLGDGEARLFWILRDEPGAAPRRP